jgi:hypothetical protein
MVDTTAAGDDEFYAKVVRSVVDGCGALWANHEYKSLQELLDDGWTVELTRTSLKISKAKNA